MGSTIDYRATSGSEQPTKAPVATPSAVIAKSKTVWGVVFAAVGFVLQPQFLALIPEKAAGIVMAVGSIIAAIGTRHAIAKNGNGQ